MFDWIGSLIAGLLVGGLARFFSPGQTQMGCFLTMLLGVVGSFVAGWLGRQIGWYKEGEAAGWIMSTLGAMLVLAVFRLVNKNEAPPADDKKS
jgi:uncharacterized membrane protein YeaQ/YmgE (transglycosylase-associated protein family)